MEGRSKLKYSIAGLNTGMILKHGGIIEAQAREYLCDFDGSPQLVIGADDKEIAASHKRYPHLSPSECEYMLTGAQFCNGLLDFDGFMLHSSAVVYEDRAYLFSAPSGTGKSTHTGIWRRVFGEENTFILNDDKPVIRLSDNRIMAYGTPWSGKTDQNKNTGALINGICFLERAETNWIERASAEEAVYGLLNQTVRPADGKKMSRLLELLDRLITKTAVYKMGCNMEDAAALTAYKGMNPNA